MGIFYVEQYRKGKLIAKRVAPNTHTREGLLHVIRVTMDDKARLPGSGAEELNPWSCGYTSAGAVVISDTMASNSFTEFTDYVLEVGGPDPTTRRPGQRSLGLGIGNVDGLGGNATWREDNDGVATILVPATVNGIFITSDSVKGGSSGILLAGGLFLEAEKDENPTPVPLTLIVDDELRYLYKNLIIADDSIGNP